MDALSEVLCNGQPQNFEVPQNHLFMSSEHDKKWMRQFRNYAVFSDASQRVEKRKMPQETVTWVKNQRTRRKANKLSEWKIKLLDRVGFIWVVNRTFDENLRDLESLSSKGEAITEPRLQYVQQRLARQLRENKPLRNGGKGRQIFSQDNILRFKQTARDKRKTAEGPDAVKDLEIHNEAHGKEDDNNNSNKIDTKESDENDAVGFSDSQKDHNDGELEIKQKQSGVQSNNGTDAINQDEDDERSNEVIEKDNGAEKNASQDTQETKEGEHSGSMNDSNGIRGDRKAENVGNNENNQEKPINEDANNTGVEDELPKRHNKNEKDDNSNLNGEHGPNNEEIEEDIENKIDAQNVGNNENNQEKPINEDANNTGVEDELPKRHNKNEKDDKKPTPTVNDNMKETPENKLPTEGKVTDDVQKCLPPNTGNRIPCRMYMIKFDSDDEEQRQGGNDKVQRELSNGCSDGFPPTDVFPDDPLSNEKKRGRNSLTLVDLVSSDDEENKGKKVKTRPQVDGGEISDDEVTFDDSVTLPFGDQEYEAVLSLTNDKHSIILGPTKWHGYYARFLKAHDPTSGSAFRSEGDVLKKIGTTNLFNLDFSSVMNILVRHKDMNENPTIVACDSYLIRRSLFLEYPFPGGTEMEKIGNTSLSSLPTMIKETQLSDEELLLARQRQKSNCKSKRACMLDQDCLNGLSPGKWLNDTVVEFWTRWYV